MHLKITYTFKRIGECNIKEIKRTVEQYVQNTLVIFYKNRKESKDMYNILIREKRVKIKQYLNEKRVILYLMRMIGKNI